MLQIDFASPVMLQGPEAPPNHSQKEAILAEQQAASHLQAGDKHHQEQAGPEFLSDYLMLVCPRQQPAGQLPEGQS